MLTGSYLKFTIKLKHVVSKCGIKITLASIWSPLYIRGQLALATSTSERICKDPHNPPGGGLNSSELMNTPVGGLIFFFSYYLHTLTY